MHIFQILLGRLRECTYDFIKLFSSDVLSSFWIHWESWIETVHLLSIQSRGDEIVDQCPTIR